MGWNTRFVILAAVLAAGTAQAADRPQLPPEVAAFLARRDRCDHFRGEESEDPARQAEIARQLRRNCRGTDAELARLKRRHAGNAAVRERLAGDEARVE